MSVLAQLTGKCVAAAAILIALSVFLPDYRLPGGGPRPSAPQCTASPSAYRGAASVIPLLPLVLSGQLGREWWCVEPVPSVNEWLHYNDPASVERFQERRSQADQMQQPAE